MIDLQRLNVSRRSRPSALVALTLDGGRLEGLVLRRGNGAFAPQNPFSVSLSLDPLTNDPELVGRELRNHLDAAQVRERHCVVGVPLKWALTTHVEVPGEAREEEPEPDGEAEDERCAAVHGAILRTAQKSDAHASM